MEVGTGEALVSCLNEDGQPCVVERAKVLPPQCLMAAPSEETVEAVRAASAPLMEKYGQAVDRESAYELINAARAEAAEADALTKEREALEAERAAFEKEKAAAAAKAAEREAAKAEAAAQREAERAAREAEHEAERAAKAEAKQREQMAKTVNSVIGQIGREAGRQLMRGLFGNLRR